MCLTVNKREKERMRKVILITALAVGLSMMAAAEGKAWTISFRFSQRPEVIIIERHGGGHRHHVARHGPRYSHPIYDRYRRYYRPYYRYRTHSRFRPYRFRDRGFTLMFDLREKHSLRHGHRYGHRYRHRHSYLQSGTGYRYLRPHR